MGGLALAPLIPGLIQHWKARLQGRRGPSPLQPYRELARLWSRSSIDVEEDDARLQARAARRRSSSGRRRPPRPVAADAPNLGVGHSMLALGGLLALARFTVCTAAWDTENGFALMGASRDLTVSVFTEAALVLSLAVAALVAGTTDLTGHRRREPRGATPGRHRAWRSAPSASRSSSSPRPAVSRSTTPTRTSS